MNGREFWALGDVSNDELEASLASLLGAGARVEARVVAHLAEVDARRLHLLLGCSSLYDYCRRRIGLSDYEAFVRIAAARVARKYPIVFGMLERRELHLTAICEVREFLTTENHRDLLEAVSRKTKLQIREILACRFPQSDVPASLKKLPALDPLSPGRYRLLLTLTTKQKEKLEHARNLLSHANSDGDLAVVVERALDELISRLEKRRFGQTKVRATREPRASEPPASQRQADKPEGSEPKRGEPNDNEPNDNEPNDNEPNDNEPKRSEPKRSEPKRSEPDGNEASGNEPSGSEPKGSEPKGSEPKGNEPKGNEPSGSEPKVSGPEGGTPGGFEPKTATSARRRKHIAHAARRELLSREGARCSFVGCDGARCEARGFLQLHHRHAWARGGSDTEDNLTLLCGAHNRLLAEQEFGQAHIARAVARRKGDRSTHDE